MVLLKKNTLFTLTGELFMNIKKFITTFLISTAIQLVLVMLIGGMYVYWGNIGGGVQLAELDKVTSNGLKNVLVLGTDEGGLRSDVIMVFSLNPKTNSINLVSIPRDTKITINGSSMKINSALTVGGEKLSVQKVKEISGIPIHDYVTFNFDAVKDLVNALGGVEFDVPQDMDYEDPEQNLYIHLKKGVQVLDGDKAIQLLRFRKYAMADIQRNSVQQDFVKAIFEQKANISYFTKIPEIYSIINENIVSSMSLSDIMKYASTLRRMSNTEFNSFEMPYSLSGNYVVVQQPEAKELFETYFTENEIQE